MQAGNSAITEKYISGLIALINEHMENMEASEQRTEVLLLHAFNLKISCCTSRIARVRVFASLVCVRVTLLTLTFQVVERWKVSSFKLSEQCMRLCTSNLTSTLHHFHALPAFSPSLLFFCGAGGSALPQHVGAHQGHAGCRGHQRKVCRHRSLSRGKGIRSLVFYGSGGC